MENKELFQNYIKIRNKIENNILKLIDLYMLKKNINYKYKNIYFGKEEIEIHISNNELSKEYILLDYEIIVNIEKIIDHLINNYSSDGVQYVTTCDIKNIEEKDMKFEEIVEYFKLIFLIKQEAKRIGQIYAENEKIDYNYIYVHLSDKVIVRFFLKNKNDMKSVGHKLINF